MIEIINVKVIPFFYSSITIYYISGCEKKKLWQWTDCMNICESDNSSQEGGRGRHVARKNKILFSVF